jgi:hypothetical protein
MTDIFHLRDRAAIIAHRRARERRDEWIAVAFAVTVMAAPLAFAMLMVLMQ